MAEGSPKKYKWSDTDLTGAVAESRSWRGVMRELGLCVTSAGSIRVVKRRERVRVKAHAVRLGLDLSHLTDQPRETDGQAALEPALRNLRLAAASLAASWFALYGCDVAIPMEPAVYDLLVSTADGIKRVQVKTTTYNGKTGWQVAVGRRPYSIGNRERQIPYDPELIDWFFIVDGDLTMYLIPSRVIAGRVSILLRTYARYIVGSAAGFITPRRRAA
jgi:hypothetical protein